MSHRFTIPRKRLCPEEGKVRYPDKKAALKRMRMLQYAHQDSDYLPVRAYLCEECLGWHVSSKEDW